MPRSRSLAALIAVLAVSATWLEAADPAVSITRTRSSVDVEIGGAPFASLSVSPVKPRPYWTRILAPGDVVITDVRPSDHRHHTGLWIGVEHVNGVDYWGSKQMMQQEEVEPGDVPGKVVNREVKVLAEQGAVGSFRVANEWIGKDGHPKLRETTTVTITPNRLMAFDITLEALAESVTFDDTKEGFFAIRVPPALTTKKGSGTIVNPDGEKGEPASWGKPNPWLDYFGEVDGKMVGVALFDHPKNFRPSRYHVRGYGLFAVSPFGEHVYSKKKEPAKPVTLKKGETLRLRYAAYVHGGDTEKADVAGAFAAWSK